MLISRALSSFKVLQRIKGNAVNNTQIISRNSHNWNYRCGPPPPSKQIILVAELTQGFAWWWVLWHMWTEPGHIFGEYGEYFDSREWTDEELGIPPS